MLLDPELESEDVTHLADLDPSSGLTSMNDPISHY